MQREDYTSNKKKDKLNSETEALLRKPTAQNEMEKASVLFMQDIEPNQTNAGLAQCTSRKGSTSHLPASLEASLMIFAAVETSLSVGERAGEKNTKSWQQRWRKLNRAWNLIWAETFFPPLREYCCEVRTMLKAGGLCEPLVLKMTADKIEPKKNLIGLWEKHCLCFF